MTTGILTSLFYIIALGITVFSGFLNYRQALSSYRVMKDFLVTVYGLTFFLLLLEFLRVTVGNVSFMRFYAPVTIALGLIEAVLLAAAAVGMYLQPATASYRTFISDVRKSRLHTIMLSLFSLISLSTIIFVSILKPYTISSVAAFDGGHVLAIILPTYYIGILTVILVFFLGYPTVMLFKATRKIPSRSLSDSLLSLPIGWAGVATIYVVFESFTWLYAVDPSPIAYLSEAILFFFITRNFRHAAMVAGLVVVPLTTNNPASDASTPSGFAGLQVGSMGGKPILLLAEPSTEFESRVREAASTFLSHGMSVYVFTTRGSRVNQAFASVEGIRLYLMAANISYYKKGDSENEILISGENPSLMLDALGKTVTNVGDNGAAIIFDSISDLVLSLGFPDTYKFLKAALEMASDRRVISLFVLLSETHEKKVENLIVGRFPIIIANDRGGIRVVKTSS